MPRTPGARMVPAMATITVDPRRCEGEKKCVEVCPMGVFAMRPAARDLPLLLRIRVIVHGGKQANVEHPERCASCGECVAACPEKAIAIAFDTA
jgi:4Fe-4S ferredoxin